MSEAVSIVTEISSAVRHLPETKKVEVLDFVEWLSYRTGQNKKLGVKQRLPKQFAKLVKEGKLELSDCSDFGSNEDWFIPTATLAELREQLKDVSVPIEEYIRRERDKRERL